ncbi:MAG: protein kinase [Nannocystaceae bacterium]
MPWGDEISPLTEVCDGRYVLLHELARGDLSIVYRAKPSGSRDSIAFKVIQPRYADDEAQVRRFRREAELLRKIEHPNVVRLIDQGTIEDGRDFIALELLVGSTLAQARARTPKMSAERTCRIARQVARALRTMHLAGVIHRDLEPSNIVLIGPEGAERAKLVDFSRAGDVGAPARRVRASGDGPEHDPSSDEPSYRAPEQVRGRPPHPTMDVFALGVIVYEMLAGEHPFYLPSAEVPGRVAPLTIRSKVFDAPEELLGLVADCIEEDSSERPASMDEVIARIDKALLWMGIVPHEVATASDEDARTQLWAAAEPEPPPSAESRPRSERDAVDDTTKTTRRPAARVSSETVWSRPERPEPEVAAPDEDTDDEPVSARTRARPRRGPIAEPEPEPEPEVSAESGDDRPLENRDPTPDPDAEQTREPTGPQSQSKSQRDGTTTGSVPRIDLDELERRSTLDEAPLVVDTVAWTKPQAAADGKATPPAKPGSRPTKPRRSSEELRTRSASQPRPTSSQPPVSPVPRWVLPLGLLVIAILAYAVWVVWTA